MRTTVRLAALLLLMVALRGGPICAARAAVPPGGLDRIAGFLRSRGLR